MNTFRICERFFKYFILGLSIAMITFIVPRSELQIDEILLIAVYSSLVYSLLDVSCSYSSYSRISSNSSNSSLLNEQYEITDY